MSTQIATITTDVVTVAARKDGTTMVTFENAVSDTNDTVVTRYQTNRLYYTPEGTVLEAPIHGGLFAALTFEGSGYNEGATVSFTVKAQNPNSSWVTREISSTLTVNKPALSWANEVAILVNETVVGSDEDLVLIKASVKVVNGTTWVTFEEVEAKAAEMHSFVFTGSQSPVPRIGL